MILCHGDFNIHVDQDNNVHGAYFVQVLQLFSYVQHVTEPTRNFGHILDLIIKRSDTEVSVVRVGEMVSDHTLVHFTLRCQKLNTNTQWITSRAWRRLSHDVFASDLTASRLCADPDTFSDMSVNEMVQLYRTVMTDLLNQHCPVVRVHRKTKHMTPWFDSECRAE